MKTNAVVLLAVIFITACATSMIGMPIDRSSPLWNYNPSDELQPVVVQETEHFKFTYKIEKISNGKYAVSGTGEYVGSQTFTSGVVGGATFSLALARHGRIVAYEYLPIIWSDLGSDVKFSKTFSAPAWDYSGITYYTEVRG